MTGLFTITPVALQSPVFFSQFSKGLHVGNRHRRSVNMRSSPFPPPPAPPRKYLPPLWRARMAMPSALRPWRHVVSTWCVKFRWRDATPTRGVVAAVAVDLEALVPALKSTANLSSEDLKKLEPKLIALREAMELGSLYWQLHPSRVVKPHLESRASDSTELDHHQEACLDVVEVEFVFSVTSATTKWLVDVIAPTLVGCKVGSRFQSVRDQFSAIFKEKKSTSRPTQIVIDATIHEEPGTIMEWHVERFFRDLASFGAYTSRVQVGALNQVDCAYFVLKRIFISVGSIPITPWVVRRVQELVKVQPSLIQFDHFTLDPRMIACNNEWVQRLAQLVIETSHHVLLTTGERSLAQKHTEGESRDCIGHLVAGILGAIRHIKLVGAFDFSLLVTLLGARHDRKLLWKALADNLSDAASASPLEGLILNAPTIFDLDDAKIIRRERRHSGKKRRIVKSITIDAAECNEAFVLELVSLVSGLESLSLSKRGSFSTSTVLKTLKRAPKIHTIELDRLKIGSDEAVMELTQAAQWQSISLTDIEIPNVSVIMPFLRVLGDPTSRLAKSLQVLRLSSRNNDNAVCSKALLALAHALRTNCVLREVHVTVQHSICGAVQEALRSHDGDSVRIPQMRQRAAFLSVLSQATDQDPMQHLHFDVIHTIFSFSAQYCSRQVSLNLAPTAIQTSED